MRLHYGLITLAQALLMGFTPGMVKCRLESGEWVLTGPGVYRAGIPVTDPYRTLIDLGSVVDCPVVEEAVDRALAVRLVTLPGILTALEMVGRQGVRGVGTLRHTLERRGVQSRLYAPSVLESKMARILKSLNLPEPTVELVTGGENQYRLD